MRDRDFLFFIYFKYKVLSYNELHPKIYLITHSFSDL